MKFFLLTLITLTNFAIGDAIKFSGEIITEKLNYKARFELLKKDTKDYQLKITLPDTNSSCLFFVNRISAPQRTRGKDGVVFSNKEDLCQFKAKSEKETKFWNEIILLDMFYRFTKDYTLGGKVILKGNEITNISKIKFD